MLSSLVSHVSLPTVSLFTSTPLTSKTPDYTPSSVGNLLRPMVSPSSAGPRTRKRSMPAIPLSPALLPDLLPFIRKITEQTRLQVATVIVALVYVNRLKLILPQGYVTEYGTSHRIFLSSVLVASKFLDDDPLTTKKLVDVTGGEIWTSKDLTRMEMAFLKFLKWDLRVEWPEIRKLLKEQNLKADELFPNWTEGTIDGESQNTETMTEKLATMRLGGEGRSGGRAERPRT